MLFYAIFLHLVGKMCNFASAKSKNINKKLYCDDGYKRTERSNRTEQ